MRREILMPSVTPAMTDAKVSRWHVAEGQDVAAGDLLVEVATPTATLEIEAEDEGRVERILVPAGTEGVRVNTPLAILLAAARERRARNAGLAQPVTFAGLGDLAPDDVLPVHASAGAREGQGQSYREALRDALAAEMRADPSVFLIGVDVAQNRGAQRVAQGLLDTFGSSRVVSAPAFDEALIGTALGAAFAGLRPVIEVTHWGRALDVLGPYLTSAAQTFYLSGGRLCVPIVFRGPNGGSPGATGEDARCVAAALAQIPGLRVVQPATAATARALLSAAIRDPGPVAVLEDERLYALRDTGPRLDVTRIGAARIARAGRDVTIAAAGHTLIVVLEAAGALSRAGIECEVIDLMSVRPLDRESVTASVMRTGRLVTVEDGWGDLGIGAELVASVAERAFETLRAAPLRIAGASVPMPYALELQAEAVPDAKRIAGAVAALVRGG
ncbi:transketolase C-terminal domain-containing protein [Hyphomicrobium sp. CS1GBMeth3]|uniref:transketolase C-terminal domain-containing protein n=1 Tax=Hyphomicrobium sp. CS1GBMeth3 TaxID=1892845 RepID=UPI0009313E6C|nr:transketolase C-terminal domain-containing protein [Hyphomicrobium sp. CS1GBMeth3]